MATIGTTSRPAYVYDQDTDTWVPVGVGPHTHENFITSTTIDAKGDLLAGSAPDTVGRLPIGGNGTLLVADSTQTLGLAWGSTLTATTASTVPLTVKGTTSQTANLFNATDLSNNVLFSILPSGRVEWNTAGTFLLAATAYRSGAGGSVTLRRSKTDTVNTNVALVSGDNIANFQLWGNDGANFIQSSAMFFDVDGAVSTGVMPGRITFNTATTSGSVERMRITSVGDVGIGTITPAAKLDVNGDIRHNNQFYAGKNKIVNGNFSVWQRNTSGFANGGFTADRMLSDNGATASRSTDAPSGFAYSLRWTAPGVTNCVIRHGIELPAIGSQGIFFDGAVFTFSIYAKSSVAGKNLTLYIAFADGTNGAARRVVVSNVVIGTTTTAWARYTYTFTIPAGASISPAACLQVTPYIPAESSDIYMTGMQVEEGSVATSFTPAGGGSQQSELALCQRYYWRSYGDSSNANWPLGQVVASGYSITPIPNPVEMRIPATSMDFSGVQFYDPIAVANYSPTTTTTVNNTTRTSIVRFNQATLSTLGRVGYLNGGTTNYIGFSAEL